MNSTLWGPPGNLRLVVVDLETCVGPDNAHRIVALGAVVCRAGGIKQRFSWLVNPGCPVDAYTSDKIHHLTDAHLADEPTWDEVLPEFRRLLVPKTGETVVLAAHNACFDVSVLRSEIVRIKKADLPDLAIIDTAGSLPRLAGVSVHDRHLGTLLDALGIENKAAHDALGDATATALAACALLERAERAGHTDLATLLATLKSGTVWTVKKVISIKAKTTRLAAPLSPAHVATHAAIFPDNPTDVDLATWRTWIAECASLRCDGLVSRAEVIPPARFRRLLFETLVTTVAAGDTAGPATVLGALAPLLADLPDTLKVMRKEVPSLKRLTGQRNQRGVALSLYTYLDSLLAPIPRCAADVDPCPACREGRPCPRDTWTAGLALAVVARDEKSAVSFWNPRGLQVTTQNKGAGRGYLAVRRVAPALADAALRVCYGYWHDAGSAAALQLADQVWRQASCRDPLITEARAMATAAAGRPADLRAALRDCRTTLLVRDGNTDSAWASLAVRTAQIEGRLARRLARPDERHQPHPPRRPARPYRFLRAG